MEEREQTENSFLFLNEEVSQRLLSMGYSKSSIVEVFRFLIVPLYVKIGK